MLELAFVDGVFQRVGIGFETVLGLDTGRLRLILRLVLLGLCHHALNLLLGETALVVGDDDLVGLARALLHSRDVHNTVGINIEGDLNLWHTTRRRWNASKLELAEQVVVLGASDVHPRKTWMSTPGWLSEIGREDLGLLGGDGGVALDESGHDAASGLNTERERSDIEQEDLIGGLGRGVTRQNGGLDSSTVGNGLIGVD